METAPLNGSKNGKQGRKHRSRENDGRAGMFYKLGFSLSKQGRFPEALKKLEILVDNYPESVYVEAALFLIGDISFKMGDAISTEYYNKAVEAYKTAIRNYPSSARVVSALFRIGKSYENLRSFHEAGAYYKRIISDFQESEMLGEVYFRLGEVAFKRNDYKSASIYFKKVFTGFPKTDFAERAIYRLADSLYQQGDLFNALSFYERAMEEFPRHALSYPLSLFNLGDIYFQNEEYEKASRVLQRAVNLFPRKEGIGTALAKLGDSYYRNGEIERAVALYRYTISEHPAGEGAMISKLRLADLAMGKLDVKGVNIPGREEASQEPLSFYREVADSDFSSQLSELALLKLGVAQFDLHEYSQAIETFKELLGKYPQGILVDRALSFLGLALKEVIGLRYEHQDFVSVITKFREHADMGLESFNDLDLLYRVGDAFQQLGLYQESTRLYKAILERWLDEPLREKVIFKLGRLGLLLGNHSDARRFLSLYIEKYPSGTMISRAYKLLGDLYYSRKDYYSARNFYWGSVLNADIGKRNMQTYFFLGNSLRKLGDYPGAADAYLKALNSQDAWGNRGKGIDYMLTSRILMADSLFDAGRFSTALEMYKTVSINLPVDEQIRWAAYRLGWCYERLGLQGKAVEAYSKLTRGEKGFWAVAAGERIADLSWSARVGKVVR